MLKFIICTLNVLAAVGGFEDTDPTTTTTLPTPTTPPIEFKEVVAIQIDRVPKCLGAFVMAEGEKQPKFVATAAHCVYGVKSSKLELVKLGGGGSKNQIQVRRVMVHPYYMPPSRDYDIALLKINTQAEDTPGLLLNKELSSGTTLKAFDLKGDMDATLEDRKSCRAKMANHLIVSTRMLCVNIGPSSVMDGSPLIHKKTDTEKYIVGVGSYYVGKGGEKYPKIFTNIANSEISSFINKYID